MHVRLTINGESRETDTLPSRSLLDVLREGFGLTGTRYGCGEGACGACAVLVDGDPLLSCRHSVEDVAERSIVTIEGLARHGRLHPVQQAFIDEDAMQCGACTSGMVIAAVALLDRLENPSEEAIREALAPHLCRCGIYGRAIKAVKRAAG